MAVNPHFDNRGIPRELDLNEGLIIESIKATGMDVMYVPRKINAVDHIMNEVTHSSFEKAFTIEMRIEGFDGYSPHSFMLDKLGLSFAATSLTLYVSKSRFREEVPDEALNEPGKPNEGDLIYIPHVQAVLEIKKADPDSTFKSGGKLHVYKMSCEAFKSSSEPAPQDDMDFISDLRQIPEVLKGSSDLEVEIETDDGQAVNVTDQSRFGDNDAFKEEGNDLITRPGR